MKALSRGMTVRLTGSTGPADQERPSINRAALVLVGLSAAAYAIALALPNFEACYFGCRTLAGYEYLFGQSSGGGPLFMAFMLAHVSYSLGSVLLLRGARRRWVVVALVPYVAFYAWLAWIVLITGRSVFNPMLGWWLWLAAGALLVAAALVARYPTRA